MNTTAQPETEETPTETAALQDHFYRDAFGKIVLCYLILLAALTAIIGMSVYFYLLKPKPIVFTTYSSFHIQPDVPLNQAYLTQPALLQWVSDVMPKAFTYDFIHYTAQFQAAQKYFTANGWHSFVNHLDAYANANTIQTNKLFITANLIGAPAVTKSGLFGVSAAWLVQMPIMISYAGNIPLSNKSLTLQVLVVRVPTMSNLNGVAIESVTVLKSTTLYY